MTYFLYIIFIYPVYMFVELIFFSANNITDDHIGLSIVILSISVNFLCLPMYNVAEQWQIKEREIQKKLKPKLKDIKAVFKGDERYMMIAAYYRQNNYHPVYALRGIFALLIQIPFFIAAYQLLSQLPVLKQAVFLFLNDLGSPDGLLTINSFTLNLLPILMTVINLMSAAVYTKDLDIREKLQLYCTPLLFFVLLYNSPSGLVLYWTLNNLFSLFKNVFYRLKLPGKIGYFIIVSFFAVATFLMMRWHVKFRQLIIMQGITIILIIIPLIYFFVRRVGIRNQNVLLDDDKKRFSVFLLAVSAFCVFIGLMLPSTIIASSPLEFVNFENISHPVSILYHTVIQSLGILFWVICLYKLFGKSTQKLFVYFAAVILLTAIVNVFVFKDPYSHINNLLVFEDVGKLRHSFREITNNLVVIGSIFCIVAVLFYSRTIYKYISMVLTIMLLSFTAVTGLSCISIMKEVRNIPQDSSVGLSAFKAYTVSKSGKNIFVLMLDRSMNFFIDPIFENSELVKKEYTGFTIFKNSIAFGFTTNFSTPSLFGGYEYTPENINNRSNELLVDKHNEALSVLPRLFSENGWDVGFTDPPWLNYRWIPDLSVFDKYSIRTKNIDGNGLYAQQYIQNTGSAASGRSGIRGIRRNMLYFSLFRILPIELRRIFYANGMYAGTDIPIYSAPFINSYSSITNIANEVEFVEDRNCLNIIVNNVTHEPPKANTLRLFGKDFLIPLAEKYCRNILTSEHFYANYLAHESCAEFFRFLKEHNCWDNSRIIIVGDHGMAGMKTTDMGFVEAFSGTDLSPECLIPLLMVKDFNSNGELKNDNTFMTLADIPSLVVRDLSETFKKNPFTDRSFDETIKKDVIKAVLGGDLNANHHLHLKQFKDTSWVYVKDNVYDPACWSSTGFEDK